MPKKTQAPPKIPGTNRISPSGVMYSRRQIRREAGRAAQKGYKQSIEAGVKKTSPGARAIKETSSAAKKAVFNLSRRVKAGRQEYLRTGANKVPTEKNPHQPAREARGLQRARSRMGKPKVRGLGFLTFVPDFLDFKNQMEAAKAKRKRAKEGFVGGGST